MYKQNATGTELVGYVCESIDLAPVPGFSGVQLNRLVALNAKGEFIGVTVLSHHEPVFLEGLGEAPLFQFVSQYKGLSLADSIRIGGKVASSEHEVHFDGVAKATASVRIINQSGLSAALKVARSPLAGLGDGGARMRALIQMRHLAVDGVARHAECTRRRRHVAAVRRQRVLDDGLFHFPQFGAAGKHVLSVHLAAGRGAGRKIVHEVVRHVMQGDFMIVARHGDRRAQQVG